MVNEKKFTPGLHVFITIISLLRKPMFFPLFLFALALAYEKLTLYDENQFQVYGCGVYIKGVAKFCKNSTSYYGSDCYCKNDNSLATLLGCIDAVGKTNPDTYNYISKYCMELAMANVSYSHLEAAFESYKKDAKAPGEIDGFNKTKIVNVPIKVNATAAIGAYEEQYVFLGNFNRSLYYGSAALGYWGVVFLIATVSNWGLRMFPGIRTLLVMNGKAARLWRKYITLPALAVRKKNDHQPLGMFSFLIPSRMESMIITGFFFFVLGCCSGQIHRVPGAISSVPSTMFNRVIADRLGIMATVMFPLFILLGGRNNFLQWLTGWKFSVFITYHRWIARMAVLMILVHAILYTKIFTEGGYYPKSVKKTYFIFGIVALTSGSLICFQGLLLLRRWWYEVFLVIHILLAVGWTIGSYYHLEEFGYLPFVFAAIGVWAFDRAVRLGRIVVFGFPKATVSLIADETLRVVVPKPAHWKSVPGGHSWLFFGKSWFFWQSHPFTFVETTDNGNIVFLCKVKTGVTKKVGKLLASVPGKTTTMRVAVEGPYGEPSPVKGHSSAVFVAGGNGIPGIYSEICDLAQKSKDNTKQVLKLYWIIRETKSLAWMFQELEELAATKIQTTIFITRPDTSGMHELGQLLSKTNSSASEEEEKEVKEKLVDVHEFGDLVAELRSHFPHITVSCGRPQIGEIVDHEIDECESSAAFVSCGHPAMVDELRHVVVSRIDHTPKRIDFYEQLQIWA